MRQIAEFIAVLACSLFTGAAVYITFIEHPARMQCGVEIAATEFAPSYRRATVMQATCAAARVFPAIPYSCERKQVPFIDLETVRLLGFPRPRPLIRLRESGTCGISTHRGTRASWPLSPILR
jgi:hypothetical protein